MENHQNKSLCVIEMNEKIYVKVHTEISRRSFSLEIFPCFVVFSLVSVFSRYL